MKFKKGQKVTRRNGGNASDFNIGDLSLMGASAFKYNEHTVFEIEGTIKLITFNHSKKIYGAYLLKKHGVNIGYVYNTYLDKYNKKKHNIKDLIQLLEQIDTDFYKGVYTVGERYDLIKSINEVLTKQRFI
jgi:hypothetical protein